jgi:hypothetical protein
MRTQASDAQGNKCELSNNKYKCELLDKELKSSRATNEKQRHKNLNTPKAIAKSSAKAA